VTSSTHLLEAGYADRDRSGDGGVPDDRLVRAAGFRNVVAHPYDTLDMTRVHGAAQEGPADLRAFLALLRDHALDGT